MASDENFVMQIINRLAKLKISSIVLKKLEQLAVKLKIDEKEILKLYVELKNNANKLKFSKIPFSKRILLLPQCLRPRDCPAKLNEFGYECNLSCIKCEISRVIRYAKKLGYQEVFIIPGGSVVEKIFKKFKPKACIGVACLKELILGSFITEKFNIIGQGIPLLRDGCVNTIVNWKDLYSCLNLR
ncbi:MAG: DUF116 domain-containing protein [archaeon GB-1867-035]|nr:DUF116 domain-containing protein [Candidatus Culexmicrobium profundum]